MLGLKKEAKIPAKETAVDHLLFLMMQVTYGALTCFFSFLWCFCDEKENLDETTTVSLEDFGHIIVHENWYLEI